MEKFYNPGPGLFVLGTTTMSTTTVYGQTSLFPCEGDVGYDGTTCLELEEMLGSRKTVCTVFTHECCLTCGKKMQNLDISCVYVCIFLSVLKLFQSFSGL